MEGRGVGIVPQTERDTAEPRPRRHAIGRLLVNCILGAIIAYSIGTVAWLGLQNLEYAYGDDADRAEIDARWMLAEYERSSDARPVVDWLLSLDGGRATSGWSYTAEWALRHRVEFVRLLESVERARLRQLAEGIGYAAGDSGLYDEFRRAFRGARSPRTRALLGAMVQAEPWLKP